MSQPEHPDRLNPYADLEGADLETLLEHAWELRQEKKALEADLARVNQALMARLGERRSYATDELSATVVHRAAKLKVASAASLPPTFLSLQPDKKAIDRHFAETGEIIEGTTLGQPSSYLTVRQSKAG